MTTTSPQSASPTLLNMRDQVADIIRWEHKILILYGSHQGSGNVGVSAVDLNSLITITKTSCASECASSVLYTNNHPILYDLSLSSLPLHKTIISSTVVLAWKSLWKIFWDLITSKPQIKSFIYRTAILMWSVMTADKGFASVSCLTGLWVIFSCTNNNMNMTQMLQGDMILVKILHLAGEFTKKTKISWDKSTSDSNKKV